MLELRGISYRYAGYAKPVLQDVDLALGDGEIVGLVGANESGKSTICLVASGLAPASIRGTPRGVSCGPTGTMAGAARMYRPSRSVWSAAIQNPSDAELPGANVTLVFRRRLPWDR